MANTENDKNKKPKQHTTPKAEALFVHIVEPDHGTKEFPDEEGSFTVTLRMPEEQAQRFLDSLNEELEEAQAQMDKEFASLSVATRKSLKHPTFVMPGTEEYDRETEEPTGYILFRFKTKAKYTNKQGKVMDRKVAVFDSMLSPVSLSAEPGWGSIMRVSFTARPYFVNGTGKAGLTFYLNAVQILKLNASGERSGTDYGFASEDDGFTADDMPADQPVAPVNGGSEDAQPDEVPF